YSPQSLYLDGKNRAVLSSHRDSLPAPLARVTGPYPDASSSNAYEIIPPGRYKPLISQTITFNLKQKL
ncbi:MAG: hypothetical protein JXB49_29705, partial [Bacteroidales bacterium]|nr:hypothetical protein [Bacteroidales bacterium]